MNLSLALRRNRFFTSVYIVLRDIWSYLKLIGKGSYSQYGEDTVIQHKLAGTERGLYFDIGCSHPFRISNTYLLYRSGWSGVAVDPIPHFSWLYRLWRPRDTFVNCGVASTAGKLKYHELLPSVLSSFDAVYVQEQIARGRAEILREYTVDVIDINTLFDRHSGGRAIDLLSIDVENLDLDILSSLDFSRHQPRCICVEYNSEGDKAALLALLEPNGYNDLHFTQGNIIALRAPTVAADTASPL